MSSHLKGNVDNVDKMNIHKINAGFNCKIISLCYVALNEQSR